MKKKEMLELQKEYAKILDKDIYARLNEMLEDILMIDEANFDIRFVEPDTSKDFQNPYLLYIPEESTENATLVVDCLNCCDKEELSDDFIENSQAIEDCYKLFDRFREENDGLQTQINTNGKTEESYDKTCNRIINRMFKGMAGIEHGVKRCMNAPIMIPMIPEYPNMTHENLTQELGIGVVEELAPQIKAMIKDAQNHIEEKLQKPINDKILMYGHSQSSTFGDHFSMVYPEMVEGIELRRKFLFCIANRRNKIKNC